MGNEEDIARDVVESSTLVLELLQHALFFQHLSSLGIVNANGQFVNSDYIDLVHDQLDELATLRPIEVELDRLVPLSVGTVHKVALVAVVQDETVSLREREHRADLSLQGNSLEDLT